MTIMEIMDDTKRPIPNGWRWVRLGEVCEVNPRRSDITRQDIEPTSFVPMEAVDAEKGMICEVRERPFADVKKGYTYFEEGDVLFAKITPCMQNGKHAIARNLIEGIGFASTEFHVIRPAKGILADWVHFFVRQPALLQDATNHFTGAVGQQRVSDDFLKSLEIPLPPLHEQRRITGVLREQMAAVEKARTAAQARLEAVKALPASLLRQVFPQPGQPLPASWRWVRLGEVCEFLDYRRKPVSETERAKRNEGREKSELYPYYGANGQAGWIDDYLFDEPLILLAEDGGAFGSHDTSIAYKIEGKTWVNNHAHVLRPRDGVDFDFCLASISIRPDLGQLVTGNTRPKLNQALAAGILIPLPPISEQRRISTVLREQIAAADKARAAAEEEINTINALPAALLRRAFKGEL